LIARVIVVSQWTFTVFRRRGRSPRRPSSTVVSTPASLPSVPASVASSLGVARRIGLAAVRTRTLVPSPQRARS
jgi:hypothetical protein